MSYGSREVLPVWAGRGTRGGRSGVPLLALSDQRKKVTKTVHFSLENFAK